MILCAGLVYCYNIVIDKLKKHRIKKEAKCIRSRSVYSNINFDCRFKRAKKRKLVLSRAEYFVWPNKRIARCISFSCSNVCETDNVVNMVCNNHSRVGEAHEMALG